MAYRQYGASAADYFVNAAGAPVPNATATVWTLEVAGTQVTDLLNAAGAGAILITGDSTGGFRFSAQDTLTPPLWIDGGGGKRYASQPTDLGAKVKANELLLATGVAKLDGTGRVAAVNLPATVSPSDGVAFKVWRQSTAPTAAQGALDGDVWVATP